MFLPLPPETAKIAPKLALEGQIYPLELRIESKTCLLYAGHLYKPFGPQIMTGLAGDVRESQNMDKNAPKPDAKLLASEPSKGLQMGQGFRKRTQIDEGQFGGPFI